MATSIIFNKFFLIKKKVSQIKLQFENSVWFLKRTIYLNVENFEEKNNKDGAFF